MRGEHSSGPLVARIFKSHFIPRLDEQPRTEVEGLLRSADNDDLLGRTADGSQPGHVSSYFGPEALVASRTLHIIKKRGIRFPQMAHHQSAPQGERKVVLVGNTCRKTDDCVFPLV